MNISKRTRFEVLKRDNFTCRYCGASPPSASLEVDHVIARVNGGTNDIWNLVTACGDCNRGKGTKRALPADRARVVDEMMVEAYDDENFVTVTQDDPYLRAIYGEIVL